MHVDITIVVTEVNIIIREDGWARHVEDGGTFSVSFSCTSGLYDLIREEISWMRSTRSEVIRALLLQGLIYRNARRKEKVAARKTLNKKHPEPKPPKKKKAKPKTHSKKVKKKK